MDPFCVVVRCEAAPAKGREQELVFEAPRVVPEHVHFVQFEADARQTTQNEPPNRINSHFFQAFELKAPFPALL